jgi:hypothetical protein
MLVRRTLMCGIKEFTKEAFILCTDTVEDFVATLVDSANHTLVMVIQHK